MAKPEIIMFKCSECHIKVKRMGRWVIPTDEELRLLYKLYDIEWAEIVGDCCKRGVK